MRCSIFVILFLLCSLVSYSQPKIFATIAESKQGWGKVTIQQESRIEAIIGKHIEINQKAKGFPGYRVQVYFGSGSDAKNTAHKIRTSLNTAFPDYDSYLVYEAPYFKVRVGDFRNRNEAYKAFKIIQSSYPGAFIVDDLIGLPRLD
ncbi:MAG: SPOR domain-containing protein [Bacteroidia bacterium]|nr:SPOR domain-containing protein [Bacteroidia bacterium]